MLASGVLVRQSRLPKLTWNQEPDRPFDHYAKQGGLPQKEEPEVRRRGVRHEVDKDVRVPVGLHANRELVRKVSNRLGWSVAEQQMRILAGFQPTVEIPHEVTTLSIDGPSHVKSRSSSTASRSITRSIMRPCVAGFRKRLSGSPIAAQNGLQWMWNIRPRWSFPTAIGVANRRSTSGLRKTVVFCPWTMPAKLQY